jgi:hypothetical protein
MRILTVILLLGFFGKATAQTPTLEALASKTTVAVNEVFTYELVSNSECVITPPDFDGFDIVGGPYQGSTSFDFNGIKGQRFTVTFELRATKKGTYTIGAGSMKCKLKKLSSQELTIKVVDDPSAVANKEKKPEHFAKLVASKSSVYVGEPFILYFKFYSPEQPSNIAAIQPGTAGGLWRSNLDPNKTTYQISREVIKGHNYFVIDVYREVCIPTRSGKITIDPYYAAMIYQVDFFSPQTQLEGRSNSLTIDVKKLPSTLPENFSGLVGRFEVNCLIDKTSLVEGNALQLDLTIKGSGNLNAFEAPKLNLPAEFHYGDAAPSQNTSVTEEGLNGSLQFNFIINPMQAGDYEIEPFKLSYFDLDSKSIREISAGTFTIHVEKGNEGDRIVYNPGDEVEVEATDIHFIHDKKGTSFKLTEFFFGTTGYLLALVGPLLLVTGVVLVKRRRGSATDEEKSEQRNKSARKIALKSLEYASQSIKQGDRREALKILQNTLFAYFMTRLNISLSSLSQKSVTAELEARNIEASLVLAFADVWKQVELAQYAPVTPENLGDQIAAARKLITDLDPKL